ncbi:glycosyltransferase family 10 domain-containing protein [Methanobrevibacter sp. UBA313]|uniref:glycosyltransferase family 10 domain-containing protein n=1 Tax=Methanobrevibacter sp. UBA313 TaxID=1915477 RepID=UPI0039B86CD6
MNNLKKREINIKFVDFEGFLDPYDDNNLILNILKKKYNVKISDNPDYLFFGLGGYEHLKYDCVRIFWTGECFTPDFNIADYALSYENLSYGDRHIRAPIYFFPPYNENLEKTIERKMDDLEKKDKFCSFVVSNEYGNNYRINLFHKLNEYKKVDSGGRYLNNIGGALGMGNNRLSTKYTFDLSHKFSIACENSSHLGYTTEKITDSFAAHCIPIYWGNPLIDEEFNSNAFINCNNFDSIDEVVEEIKRIDNNEELYYKMVNEIAFLGDFNKFYLDLENFLYNIFNQPLEKAYRRERVMFGKTYEHNNKMFYKIYYKPYHFLINILIFLHIDNFLRNIYHKFKK